LRELETVKITYPALSALSVFVTVLAGCGKDVPEPQRVDRRQQNGAPHQTNPQNNSSLRPAQEIKTQKFVNLVPAGFEEAALKPGGACNFDSIGGQPRDSAMQFSARRLQPLKVIAWAAISVDEGVIPQRAFFTLKDEKGTRYFADAGNEKRDDLAIFFKAPKLAEGGLSANIDLTAIPVGPYKLEILMAGSSGNFICGINKNLDVTDSI
jgi:hypothetical protein